MTTHITPHHPVLLDDTVRILDPQVGQTYLDGTAGYGGHAQPIAKLIGSKGRMILVDRDANAIRALSNLFDDAEIIHNSYLETFKELASGEELVDMILLDLGVSSPQLDVVSRGFSFRGNADLDMRMDQSQGLTAATVVNNYRESELVRILSEYGEERRSKSIAKAIVAARPISTTTQLSSVIKKVAGSYGDNGGHYIDPSTRTFQALRIEVNDELNQLREALPLAMQFLAPNGRLVVISFHSLEDRIVKQFIDRESRDCICPPKTPICVCGHHASLTSLTKHHISGATNDPNPRARSAKLRAAAKNQNK